MICSALSGVILHFFLKVSHDRLSLFFSFFLFFLFFGFVLLSVSLDSLGTCLILHLNVV